MFDEVVSVRPTAHGTVELRAGGALAEHDRVIVCAGRGTAALARGADVEIPVVGLAHVRLAFPVRGAPPERLACLLDGSGAFGEPGAYADPLPGNDIYAVGVDETPVAADGGLTDPDGLAAIAARTIRYVERALPGLVPEPVQARHCWITELPWANDAFAVWTGGGRRVPGRPQPVQARSGARSRAGRGRAGRRARHRSQPCCAAGRPLAAEPRRVV